MRADIELVVFDLGGVLVDIDHRAAVDWLLERGCRVAVVDEFAERSGLREHECGELSGERFLARVNGLLESPADPEELRAWWNGLFSANRRMLAMARALRRHYRVCILSNTGSLHWAQAREQFDLATLADDTLTSFEAGMAKPDPAIFALAGERFGAVAGRTVFIDDLAANAAAASAAGWHAIRHRDADGTHASLRSLGVRLDSV